MNKIKRVLSQIWGLLKVIYHNRVNLAKRAKRRAQLLVDYVKENRKFAAGVIAAFVLLAICNAHLSGADGGGAAASHKKRNHRTNSSINMLITNEMTHFNGVEKLDSEIVKFMRKWELTGGSFALMRNDKLIYAKGYGFADKQSGERCDVKHVFRIASASKLITGIAVMKLIEQGKLKLSTKVYGAEGILNDTRFLDILDPQMKNITVEHLLRHTSGFKTPVGDPAFANYTVAKSLGCDLPLSLDDVVEYSTHYRLCARPGTRYDYSNLGYMVLGKVVEVVSGEDYEEYVTESVLRPAGCLDMYIGRNYSKNRDDNEVMYYEVKEAERVPAYDGSDKMVYKSNGGNNVTLLGSAGGWVASPVELLRLVASVNGNSGIEDILTKKSVRTMTNDSPFRTKKPIGWAIVNGSEWLRSGSMSGTTALIKQQKDGYTWVFVTNSSAWIGYRLTDHISTTISKAISGVSSWPSRDLFEQ